jgi:hypothetical protein
MLSYIMCLLFEESEELSYLTFSRLVVRDPIKRQSTSLMRFGLYAFLGQLKFWIWPLGLYEHEKTPRVRPLCVSARAKNAPAFANKVLNARKAANNNFSITPCALSQIFFSLSTLLLAFLLREETRAIL